MMASFEAWTGDPHPSVTNKIPTRKRFAAKTAADMVASLEAWTGDPPLARTPTLFSAALVAWDDDPLVREAMSFAASLEAWTGYPPTCQCYTQNRKEKKKEQETHRDGIR